MSRKDRYFNWAEGGDCDEDEDDISYYNSSDSDSDIVKDVVMGFFFG